MRSSIKFMNYFKTNTYQLLFLDGMILDSEGPSFLRNNVIRSLTTQRRIPQDINPRY